MTFLVLDEDAGFRSALAEVLRDDGHRVEEFASTPDLSAVRALGNIDAVFAHYHLLQQDDMHFADELQSVYPGLPIVILTADPWTTIDAAVNARPYTTLRRKPLAYSDVRALVEQIASERSRRGC